ncbi:hypothetical protein TH25_14040 [Thalassospira profundimaris]|uniref:OmpA-like domain-containing protein n=1 Tax=Thalassospira profundimaris TaxID=502049 RepID=A0A367X4X2_9PROT|nr:OmpA family protein [Thalassospira profundimaris]RCK48714.1 hypothetical protein TH25_14040 [Thalassospira profundimaris]
MGVSKRTLRAGHKQPGLRGLLKAGSALAVILMLGACSSVPDAINPAEWGRNIGDAFSGQEGPQKSQEPIPGQDQDYPRLADTPDRPVVANEGERQTLLAGLAADRANARYTAAPAQTGQAAKDNSQPVMPSASTGSQPESGANSVSSAATQSASKTPETLPEPAKSMPEPKPADLKVTPLSKEDASSSGSRIVDQWNAKAAQQPAPVPKPVDVPAEPNLTAKDVAPAAGETRAEQAARAESDATLRDAPPVPAAPNLAPKKLQAEPPVPGKVSSTQSSAKADPAASAAAAEDPVMSQYKKRLAEGEGQFDPAPMPSNTGNKASGDFDYSMYNDNGSVKVDESQLQDGVPPAPALEGNGPAVEQLGETPDELLASRLGVKAVDQLSDATAKSQVAQIQFAYGSAKLSSVDVGVLRKVSLAWKKHRKAHVMVIGHASSKTENMSLAEHEKANRMISERRASAVINQLLALGVNPDAIYVSAEGASDPRYFEGVPAGEAGNRRVEIFMD